MSVNTKIPVTENGKMISVLKELAPKMKITEVKHIYVNTFWITLAFAIALALFILIKF
ncbi:MAG: hypothetical protein ACXVNR_01645 [Bacteroidia bacterium]